MKYKALIVPCSGIDKTDGTVAREGTQVVTEDLRSQGSRLEPPALVVVGHGEMRRTIEGSSIIAVGGCKIARAAGAAAESGGRVTHAFRRLDVYRGHRRLKAAGIAEPNEAGQESAKALADEASLLVDEIAAEGIHA